MFELEVAVFLFLLSFVATIYVMPRSIRSLEKKEFLVLDMYKKTKPQIPTNGGLIVLFISFVSVALLPLVLRLGNLFDFFDNAILNYEYDKNSSILFVILIYALYGLIDDLVELGRKIKIFLPILFSIPLISVINPETLWLPIIGDVSLNSSIYFDITWNDIFRILVIPLYVMVVSNLVNMHSGYNGLQSGLSFILLLTIIIKSWFDESLNSILVGCAFLGSILAFLIFNRYPAKVLEGNIGSQLFGSLIGCVIVIQNYWWFGFFILLPHTFNFVLWIIWLVKMKTNPKVYLDGDVHEKFGKVRDDGSLKVPNCLTLKWIPNFYFRINEPTSVYIQYGITIFFCLSGLIIF